MTWARDSFKGTDGVWGGEYVDLTTPFGMREKTAHVICGALLFACAERFAGVLAAGLAVLLGGVLVEYVEMKRKAAGKTFFADGFSWRDLVANFAGATLAWCLL